jgi:predicted ATP-grasp superfamily ATP-dependent carboligase
MTMIRTRKDGPAPAVLLDVNLQALKVIRSLGRSGIPVIGVVPKKGRWEHSTRYCEIRECANPHGSDEALLKFLIDLAAEFNSPPVLIPMHDDNVLFIARNDKQLKQHFRFLTAEPDTIEALVSKSGMRDLAQSLRIPQPMTASVQSAADVENLVGLVSYPALFKPTYSRSWQTKEAMKLVSGKVVVVNNDQQLLDTYKTLAELDPRLVVQEIIPGPDNRLVYYIGYFDENSDALASFVGVKERVIPVHFGSASFVVSRFDRDVIDMCTKFMKQIGYKGHVGIELKYDERDSTYKLIEVNARFGLWDGLPSVCGIDFARINYDYLHGCIPKPYVGFDDGVKWISFERDLRAFVKYRREGALTLREWISSIGSGRRDFAVFALDDPVPFILSSYHLIFNIIKWKLRLS